jgi:hypothetical protein
MALVCFGSYWYLEYDFPESGSKRIPAGVPWIAIVRVWPKRIGSSRIAAVLSGVLRLEV